MNLIKAKYLVLLLIGFACQQAHSQDYTPISGVINDYTSITSILSADDNNVDSVVVTNSTDFFVDDTVMIYCVKGATIGTDHDSTYLPGNDLYPPGHDDQLPGNTGKYAFMRITEKIGTTLVLNAEIGDLITPLEAGEVAQLIKVRSFRYANVTAAGLGADHWDPASGTGGVVALFVHGVLRLDGDIDVTGAGFKGAPGSSDVIYTAGCSGATDTMDFYEPFYLDGEVQAGLKGEGTTDTRFLYTRGWASNINGGGGGVGLQAGGGGGSNYGAGVRGGKESTSCDPGVSETGGNGGFDLGRTGYYYVNEDGTPQVDYAANRIFFGGGGGSGTQTANGESTDGGDGGGIVIIVADTIMGNGHSIIADGGDVSGTAGNGGAGAGGGGGGAILLEVAGYQSTLNLYAIGGDGGNSFSSLGDTTGMGGAGGGGAYWLAGDTHPGVSKSFATGSNGRFLSPIPYDGDLDAPRTPGEVNDLEAPLRGFVFNPVPFEYTYCSDVDPDPIITPDPKGGDGTYTYLWIDSSSNQNFWDDAPGTNDERDYNPPILTDTTYYRRIVTSAGLADTSYRIAFYIHEAIAGNTIAAEDTVCYGLAPELFESTATISGGYPGVTYNYKWQHRPDGAGSYTDVSGTTTEPTYQAPGLDISTDYRRIAYAGVCVSTSNAETVTVLPAITGNDITPNDTICISTIPDLINGPAPSGGDQGDLRYQWIDSTSTQDWTLISGETALAYQSPALSQTTYIRRVVLSGEGDACVDTSAYVEILNVPDITGNIISSDQTLCQEDQAGLLNGSGPGGGYMGQYDFTWISSTDQTTWLPAGGNDKVQTGFDPGVMDGDTTWYRRVVGSGGLELVCKDTSDFIVINVLPSITNNVLSPADDLKCQLDMPELISGSLPGGGATVGGNDPTRAYRWELARTEGEPGSGDWTHPSSGAVAQDYMDPDQLLADVDRWYRRIVTSGPPGGECIDTSDLVHLVVHSQITANDIDVAEAICFNTSRELRNVAMTGGETGITPVYTWRQWLEGESSADAVDIPGSDYLQYESGPYTDPGTLIYSYDRIVEIGACRDTSNAMLVTVMQIPGGVLTDPDFDPVCEQDAVLNLDLNMDAMSPGHYTTPWEVILTDGINPGIDTGLVDQDVASIDISLDTYGADHVSYTYEIESIRYYPEADDYYCISTAAELPLSPVGIDVSRRPDPFILVDGAARDSFKVCSTTALLEMNPDNGTLSQWSEPTGSVFFSPGGGTNEYNVSIPNNSADFGAYRIYIQSEAGDCAGLDSIDLHFFEQPAPSFAGLDTTLWLVNSVQLRADPPTAGIGTWTVIGGSGRIDEPNNPNSTVFELSMGDENEFRWTVTNGEDEGTCTTSNDVTIVTRNEVKRYNGFSPNGDMSNEYYIMQGLPYADEFSVSFFNSLGSTVQTISNENIDVEVEVDPSLIAGGLREDEMVIWDGKASNGNPVPSGTYYYVVTYITHQRDYITDEIVRTDSYEFSDYVVIVRE